MSPTDQSVPSESVPSAIPEEMQIAGESLPQITDTDSLEAVAAAQADAPETFGEALAATETPEMTAAVEKVLSAATEDSHGHETLAVRDGRPVTVDTSTAVILKVVGDFPTRLLAEESLTEAGPEAFIRPNRNQFRVYGYVTIPARMEAVAPMAPAAEVVVPVVEDFILVKNVETEDEAKALVATLGAGAFYKKGLRELAGQPAWKVYKKA